jgi:hypothetical protein
MPVTKIYTGRGARDLETSRGLLVIGCWQFRNPDYCLANAKRLPYCCKRIDRLPVRDRGTTNETSPGVISETLEDK